MTYLLDTHTLLWWLDDDKRLSRVARDVIGDGASQVFVSAASVWEISIKERNGKLRPPTDLLAEVNREGFDHLVITLSDAYAAGALPRHHNDPFDRMLVAQAMAGDLTIVTRDPRIAAYEVRTLTA